MRYAMVIDLRKCMGCNACTVACKQENGTLAGVYWSKVLQYEEGRYPSARLHFLPVLCMHCASAPCLDACPSGASYRHRSGAVLVNHEACLGCRYCIMACPYEARSYRSGDAEGYYPGLNLTAHEEEGYEDHPRGAIEKCTFCAHRLDEGKDPACVVTCPAGARIFGDLDDPTSEVARLVASGLAKPRLEDQGTEPSVFYIDL